MTRQELVTALASGVVRISRTDAIELAERKELGIFDRYHVVFYDAGTWESRSWDCQKLEDVYQLLTNRKLEREKATVYVNHFQRTNRSRVFTAKAVLA